MRGRCAESALLVGEGWAKRMILCGERVDADTALRIGLVEVTAKGGGLLAAQALAQKSLSNHLPPSATLNSLSGAARNTPPGPATYP